MRIILICLYFIVSHQLCYAQFSLDEINIKTNGSLLRSQFTLTDECTILEEDSKGDYYIYSLNEVEISLISSSQFSSSEFGYVIRVNCCDGNCIGHNGKNSRPRNIPAKIIEIKQEETALKVVALFNQFKEFLGCLNPGGQTTCIDSPK